MEQKDENNRGGELKLKLKGGKKSLFIFIQKAFKHNNSFVDVGGILWTVFFFHLNLLLQQRVGTALDAASLQFSEDGQQWNWQQCLGKAVSDFRPSWCKETQT